MRCYNMQRGKNDEGYYYYPCGYCDACRHNDSVSWGLRSYLESLYYKNNIFLSLSYDDEHLPKTNSKYVSGNLKKSDVQKFKKLLAYYCGPFRFVLGGEYGDKTLRPHYHLCCFGISLDDPVFFDRFYSSSKKAWIAKCKAWDKGEVCVRELLPTDCFYVSKYSLKGSKNLYSLLEQEGTPTPFRLCSKGIGLKYLNDNIDRLKVDGFIRYKGFKMPIPRYFFDKMYPPQSQDRLIRSQFLRSKGRDYWSYLLSTYGTRFYVDRALCKQQHINLMKGK